MAACALSVAPQPAGLDQGQAMVLKRKLSAIQIEPGKGASQFGLFLHLGVGAEVEICGAGFSERTVQVRSAGAYYFVLRDSLTGARPS